MKINQSHCFVTSPVFFIYCTKIYPELSSITRLQKLGHTPIRIGLIREVGGQEPNIFLSRSI